MNIKKFNSYKRVFEFLIDTLPLEKMEFDIQQNKDLLIQNIYESLNVVDREIIDQRTKKIYHKLGIAGIYAFMDPVYGDLIRWIIFRAKTVDVKAKNPRDWRINKIIKEDK